MKTNPAPILLTAVVLVAAGVLSSCSTTGGPSGHAPGNAASTSSQDRSIAKNWVKISDQPPVWAPRGVTADVWSDHRQGEWVFARDAKDTRYFIPLHGLPRSRRDALVQEALAMRDKKACRAYEQRSGPEVDRERAWEVAGAVAKLPFLTATGVFYALGARGWTEPPNLGAVPSINVPACVGGNLGAGCGGR